MVGYQLDDEPNLYIGNGWKSPLPPILNWLALGFQDEHGLLGNEIPKHQTGMKRSFMFIYQGVSIFVE